MDYLLDRYIYAFLPFTLSDASKLSISSMGMSTVRMADWFCKTQDVWKFYSNHPSFLWVELLYPFLALITFVHAYRHGGRYVYTWMGICICQLTFGISISFDVFPNLASHFNICWNAQGLATFFGGRFPLSTIFGIQQVLLYASYVFAQRMYLSFWSQGLATGLGYVLLKFPLLVVGTRFLWWTWQDKGPSAAEKIYGIPLSVFLLDLLFACNFVWILHMSRSIALSKMYDWKKFGREFLCAFAAGLLSFWMSLAQFLTISTIIQLYGIPFGIIVCSILFFSAIAVYIADRRNPNPDAHTGNPYWFDELSLAICIHFIFVALLISIVNPVNIVSEGLHQPVGACNKDTYYLCPEKINGIFYDFHCIPGGKLVQYESGLEWYAICGTKFANRAEYMVLILFYCILASLILYQAAAASGKTPHIYRIVYGRLQDTKKKK